MLAQCKLLGDLARAAVQRELDVQRRQAETAAAINRERQSAAATPVSQQPRQRQAGDDDDLGDQRDEDVRPGDPAFERQRGRNQNWQDDGRNPDRRREDREEASRRYKENYPPPDRDERPARRDDRGSGRGGDRQERTGPPETARQFLGWLNKQDDDVKRRAQRIGKSWNLPSMYKNWDDREAQDVYRELTSKPESSSHRNGSGNGHHEPAGRGSY